MGPWIVVLAGGVGVVAGVGLKQLLASRQLNDVEAKLRALSESSARDLERIRKEAELNARQEIVKVREELEATAAERRRDLAQMEERLFQREANLDRKELVIEKKETSLEERLMEAERQRTALAQEDVLLKRLIEDERARLQAAAGMTAEEARAQVLTKAEEDVRNDVAAIIRRRHEEAREDADRHAQKIISEAIQRCTLSHSTESMTSTVSIPGEEMKGRIIGREGRNIKALEAATGVTIVIDDTPDAVVVSAFDPVRREMAKRVLILLMEDGRIHPARIEEVVAKVNDEMAEVMREAGEQALVKADVQGVSPEVTRILGRLTFRTSYTQNVLKHSIEVAHLMGVMAAEMGLDTALARRVGLFHDIGKALDHEIEGPHAVIGGDLLRQHGELPVVINGVAGHHEDVPVETIYALLASAADSISGSRLGARSETTQIYVKRLEKLEQIACSFPGVQKSYAIQAGREIRVIVEPSEMDDGKSLLLARDVTQRIENELQYPGQIRVVVIRETRAVEYAK